MHHSLATWTRDFLHAARALRRAPGFAVVTVVTLALAIGSNAAMTLIVMSSVMVAVAFAPEGHHGTPRGRFSLPRG